MTTVTPAILGPGIEEEYDDVLTAIGDLRYALGHRTLTNATPDGRVLLEVAWLEQEIRRQRLPIPVNQSYAGTVYQLAGSNELVHVPGPIDAAAAADALHRLFIVLKGYGLYKPRHLPVLIDMIDELYADARKVWDRLSSNERTMMDDMEAQGGYTEKRPVAHSPTAARSVSNRQYARVGQAGRQFLQQEQPHQCGHMGRPSPLSSAQGPPCSAGIGSCGTCTTSASGAGETVALIHLERACRSVLGPVNPNGAYWQRNLPESESEWRSGSAVLNDWNGDGGYVQSSTAGLRGWIGPAAPQVSSDGTSMLTGQGEQIWLPPGSATPSTTIRTPWNAGE